jgi:PAS domain S-box-containing protein
MSFNLMHLVLIGTAYLSILFGVAYSTQTGLIPRNWISHPITYTLTLGVYASAWALFGSVGFAYQSGYGFLAYYLGVSGAFLLAPVLLIPILRITRTFQLSSLADLLAFRYRSPWAGTLSSVVVTLSGLILISMQIQIFSDIVAILSPGSNINNASLLFCLAMVLTTIFFGATRGSDAEKSEGLIAALAFASVSKLVIFLTIGCVAVFYVFGGVNGLNEWLDANGQRVSAFERHLDDSPWRALLLIFFASAIVMPHMFHVVFKENISPKTLYNASWGLPFYLFLISLPIAPILWASIKLGAPTSPALYTLGLTLALNSPALAILVYIGALAAASGLIMVTTFALAAITLNHWVLPIYKPLEKENIYSWLQWIKSILIASILLASWVFYKLISEAVSASELIIIAFSAGLQLFPAVLGVLYWPLANHKGLISGLAVGMLVWFFTMFAPPLVGFDISISIPFREFEINANEWHIYSLIALTLNMITFALVSIFTETPIAEQNAAQSCSVDTLSRPARRELEAGSSEDFRIALTKPLGANVAQREISRALKELNLPEIEYRPYALRRLRDQVEANLSGMLGPSVAQKIVKRHLSYKPTTATGGRDIHFVERTLEDYQSRLTGLAAELDSLRRYHRQTLQNLPIATCSLGGDMEILMWNQAMEQITEIAANEVIGSRIFSLPSPWSELLYHFAQGDDTHLHKQRIDLKGKPHWLSLHKAMIDGPENSEQGQVILVEDNTETQLLEDKLIHSERLASVGRLAAGVAHEVGNPVTGIACLAQNMKLETKDEAILEISQQIITQTKRISHILQSLMNFARTGNHAQPMSQDKAKIQRCVQEAIDLLSLSDKEMEIEYLNFVPATLTVVGDEQRLVQVFINLLDNAKDASPPGSVIRVSGKLDGYSAIIEVTDMGCGIDPQKLDHIFEPFYTTKGPDRGTGLGLSLVYSIIEEHYGYIQVFSPANTETGTGTKVVINLPASFDATTQPAN